MIVLAKLLGYELSEEMKSADMKTVEIIVTLLSDDDQSYRFGFGALDPKCREVTGFEFGIGDDFDGSIFMVITRYNGRDSVHIFPLKSIHLEISAPCEPDDSDDKANEGEAIKPDELTDGRLAALEEEVADEEKYHVTHTP